MHKATENRIRGHTTSEALQMQKAAEVLQNGEFC